ncbi:MAG: hypothetical protein KA765_04050 [Thermoflexales bacterium]|nr:hypothetical protein [Thermoflexales bacterium]
MAFQAGQLMPNLVKPIKLVLLILIPFLLISVACLSTSDCGWTATAKAWIDQNENGIWDKGEQPFQGVVFRADDAVNYYAETVTPTTSNSKGAGELYHPGAQTCGKISYQIYTDVPQGYRLTTASRLAIQGKKADYYGPYLFGFTSLPGVPTSMPPPPAPICNTYQVKGNLVNDIAIAPDQNTWIATAGGGVYEFDPHQNVIATFSSKDGLADNTVRSITFDSKNAIWFGTYSGVSRLEGSTWKSYSLQDRLISNHVQDIAISEDGIAWIATGHGISRFDLSQNSWTNYTTSGSPEDNYATKVIIGPDSSVWFGLLTNKVARLLPSSPKETNPLKTTISFDIVGVNDMKLAPDGAMWILGSSVIRFDDTNSKVTEYNSKTNNALFNLPISIDIASDGSVWIGTDRAGAIHFAAPDGNGSTNSGTNLNTEDGLASDHISSIAVEPSGAVWFGTDKGVTRCVFPYK